MCVYINLENPDIHYTHYKSLSKYNKYIASAYNNHSIFLVSIVIIILAILILRRLLGIPSRAIRVTARNIRSLSFNLRLEDSPFFLNYASPAPP
jgi:hypothetical protein